MVERLHHHAAMISKLSTSHHMAPLFFLSATLQTCNPEEGPHFLSSHVN